MYLYVVYILLMLHPIVLECNFQRAYKRLSAFENLLKIQISVSHLRTLTKYANDKSSIYCTLIISVNKYIMKKLSKVWRKFLGTKINNWRYTIFVINKYNNLLLYIMFYLNIDRIMLMDIVLTSAKQTYN